MNAPAQDQGVRVGRLSQIRASGWDAMSPEFMRSLNKIEPSNQHAGSKKGDTTTAMVSNVSPVDSEIADLHGDKLSTKICNIFCSAIKLHSGRAKKRDRFLIFPERKFIPNCQRAVLVQFPSRF